MDSIALRWLLYWETLERSSLRIRNRDKIRLTKQSATSIQKLTFCHTLTMSCSIVVVEENLPPPNNFVRPSNPWNSAAAVTEHQLLTLIFSLALQRFSLASTRSHTNTNTRRTHTMPRPLLFCTTFRIWAFVHKREGSRDLENCWVTTFGTGSWRR